MISKLTWIAHRGASFDAPENTLAAARLAWEQGVDMVEFDVRLSADDHAVIIHDANTLRTGGRDAPVHEQTFDELRELDVGAFKGEAWTGERIPLLKEMLETLPPEDGKKFLIEIKCGVEVMPELVRVVEQTELMPDRAHFGSFSPDVVRALRTHLPEYTAGCFLDPTEWLADDSASGVSALTAHLHAMGATGFFPAARETLTRDVVSAMRTAGFLIYVWTVNDLAAAQRLREIGVNAIVSDRAAWLAAQLRPEST